MYHREQHVLVAIALMAASILLQGVCTTATTTSANLPRHAVTTAYDVLEQNNLPRGLLPLGVESYDLNPGGAFQVTLPGECNFFVMDAGMEINFRYDSNVAGTIKSGSISRLSGARIQGKSALFGFSQVTRAGSLLKFWIHNNTEYFRFTVSAFAQSANCSGLLLA